MANASTVTAAFARKLQAAFTCKGSDYGGGGCGGGAGGGGGGGDRDRRRVVVAGKDSCSAATRLPIGAPCPGAWIVRRELISRALGDGGSGGSGGSGGGSGGGVSIGKGSWSLARAVVCVVMGAIGKVFPTKVFFMGASFSSHCHSTTLHGNLKHTKKQLAT